jgi:hypothetical protein
MNSVINYMICFGVFVFCFVFVLLLGVVFGYIFGVKITLKNIKICKYCKEVVFLCEQNQDCKLKEYCSKNCLKKALKKIKRCPVCYCKKILKKCSVCMKKKYCSKKCQKKDWKNHKKFCNKSTL